MSSSDGARSVGITQDLMARRKEPTRAGLGAAVSASEALLGHLRGLSTGLPGPDRALLTLLAERVRRGDLPPRGPADPARARHLAERGRLPSLDRAARVDPELWGWAAALRSPAELVVLDDAELAHARLAGLAAIDLADAAGVSPVEAFLGAALHDLGRPFLRGLAASLARPPRPATVQQLAEGLHPAVGSVLLERWGLPAAACLAVEHHHLLVFGGHLQKSLSEHVPQGDALPETCTLTVAHLSAPPWPSPPGLP